MGVAVPLCNNTQSRQQALDELGPIQERPEHRAQRVIDEICGLRISGRQIELGGFDDETEQAPDKNG
jgi:hypothetical protein